MMTRARRNAEVRLKGWLRRRRLMFVEVGGRAVDDRAIATHVERQGATVSSREYNRLIRDIVETVAGITSEDDAP